MLRNYKLEIEIFSDFFETEIERAKRLCIDGEAKPATLHKKLVFVAIFDSLSKCVFPKKGNRDRVTSFLVEFSEWEDHDRISLPHLFRLLKKSPEPAFSELRNFTTTRLKDWAEGDLIRLSKDPKITEVQTYWPNDKDYKKLLNGISIDSFRHSNLFYSYRNALVHEFRNLGYGNEDKRDEVPYYISFTNPSNEDEQDTWELVYPVVFFEKITNTAFINLKNYLIEYNINPNLSYNYGSYWLDELNE